MQPINIQIFLLMIVVMVLGKPYITSGETPDAEEQVTLTPEEAAFVRWLIGNDKMVEELSRDQKALSWMNKVATAVPGPVGILAKWNMGTLKGWRMANQKLAKLKQQVTCDRIDLMLASETENKNFFEHLYEARGCNQ